MLLDPPTMLTLSIALAAAAALYLAVEWRSIREPSLLYWSAGFAVITVGCTLSLLRMAGLVVVGVWFANGLLIAAHFCFLLGVARFTEVRIGRAWYLIFVAWAGLLLVPDGPLWSKLMLIANSVAVAVLALRASWLLRPHGGSLSVGAVQLRYVLLGHGVFYLAKTIPALVPGTLIDLTVFRGEIIQVSLVEGAIAIMLIALSMTGTERYRREERITRLAAHDPLTALLNRRALSQHADAVLADVSPQRPGAVLLIDVDNFKLVNDLHGHAAGDRLLVLLSDRVRASLPPRALAARLGGDEFLILLPAANRALVEALAESLRSEFNPLAASAFITPAPVTLSIGAQLFDRAPSTLEALIEQSDAALYCSKRDGRNRLHLVDLAEPMA